MDKIEFFLNNPWVSGIGASIIFSIFVFLTKKFWEYMHKSKALKTANSEIINILLIASVNLQTVNLIYIQSIMDSVYRKNKISKNKQNLITEIINDLITEITKLQYISNDNKNLIIKSLLNVKTKSSLDDIRTVIDFPTTKKSESMVSIFDGILSNHNFKQFFQIYISVISLAMILRFLYSVDKAPINRFINTITNLPIGTILSFISALTALSAVTIAFFYNLKK